MWVAIVPGYECIVVYTVILLWKYFTCAREINFILQCQKSGYTKQSLASANKIFMMVMTKLARRGELHIQ